MKLPLDFSNPNNACLSLRTIAELIRSGELRLHEAKEVTSPGSLFLTLDLSASGGRGSQPKSPAGKSELTADQPRPR